MKPTTLCKLKKGKALGAFDDFVDTFNWLVDFCQNLKGDGEKDKNKHIKVDRTNENYPTITFSGSSASGGGAFKVVGTDGSEATVGDGEATNTLTFASAADSDVRAIVTGSGGNVTVTFGVYWK